MMLTHNEAYYMDKGYGAGVHDYFTNYPAGLLILWIGNLFCGLLSPILYLCGNQYAYKAAFLSFAFDLLLISFGVILKNRIDALGFSIFVFDLFILLSTLLFGIYAYFSHNEGK